jgi:hypothetical protein
LITDVGNGALILPKVELEAEPAVTMVVVVVDLIGKISLV